jgi:hypothetical protein
LYSVRELVDQLLEAGLTREKVSAWVHEWSLLPYLD